MEKLFELQKVIFEQFQHKRFYARRVYERFTFGNRINGIVGPRGVGKTTFLLHDAIEHGALDNQALYVSADHILFVEFKLFDLVNWLYQSTRVRRLYIDEIHKYGNWNQELKNISDTFLEFDIIFTGSSTIDIVHSQYDLSRRVTLYPLCGFSFREFLEFYYEIRTPVLTLSDIIDRHEKFSQEFEIPVPLVHFKEYLKNGYYPFIHDLTDEISQIQSIENAVQKVIYEDIAVLHSLKTPTLLLLEKLFKYVLHSQSGELSISKIASTIGKDFESVTEYFGLLHKGGLIRFLYSQQSGKAHLRNPTKIYPDNTNMIHAISIPQSNDAFIGKIRETFVINQFQNADHEVYYSSQGDFAVDDIIFEVGGKNKTRRQLKHQKNSYLLLDDMLFGFQDKIPLYWLGFLY